ncbi:geminin-like isoform X2 [Mercenaria mercenaria]|uniref:geminin-like isoform X2 n=1 Tax=Mercenaria mercenaria TaxID=6596 RepID=UPI00234EE793|nr:geminin-like isoform X2 [Mercenaria mercenaria]
MSTAVSENKTNKENSPVYNKTVKSSAMDGGERRTLKTLQLSSCGTLIGSEKHPGKNRIIASKKPLKIFQDKKSPGLSKLTREVETQTIVNCKETEAQTDVTGATGVQTVTDSHNDSGAADLDQEAYDLMARDPIPESYWRELAEERRLSLAEALTENEQLHQSMEELKEENQNLSLLASQAEHLASVLNDVLGGDGDETTDEKETTESVEEVSEADKAEEGSESDEHEATGESEKQEEDTS